MKAEQPESDCACPDDVRITELSVGGQARTKESVPSPQPTTVPEKKGIVPADLIKVPRRKTDLAPQKSPKKK